MRRFKLIVRAAVGSKMLEGDAGIVGISRSPMSSLAAISSSSWSELDSEFGRDHPVCCKDGPCVQRSQRWNEDLTCSRKGLVDINCLKQENNLS
ncbi:hypothetical protein L3X38_011409 [Prunus dulcis]|uniref:Uncharacterized protein n=1 Tax=Prunus dulcis TaxID=3755 RepID=A0AAD4WHA9_PRUDU|nr:hypothetical protein L3X38_011409 [Prunus dulcis]